MKMTKELYDALKADIAVVLKGCGFALRKDTSTAVLWRLLHEVNAQRSYDDSHPRWTQIPRWLPLSPNQDHSYLNVLYRSGLNDSHIETALKKIAQEWEEENKKEEKKAA